MDDPFAAVRDAGSWTSQAAAVSLIPGRSLYNYVNDYTVEASPHPFTLNTYSNKRRTKINKQVIKCDVRTV